MKVHKAVVLAAGLGTRLRPFTCVTPKPLLPVWGETMLDRIVALLLDRGVDDIAVNAHHLPEQIHAWADDFRRRCGDRARLRISDEPEILGSGGALNPLREWIGDEPFYLANADVVMENAPDLAEKFAAAAAAPDVVGLALVAETGPRTVEVEPASGFVTNWRSDDAGAPGTFTYCGLAMLKPDILAYVPPSGFSSIVDAYDRAAMDGRFVRAVSDASLLWEDAGAVQRYVDLNRDGDDNAFADLPQLRAAECGGVEFLCARGSERVFFRCDRGIAIVYDDGNRQENGLYAGHARWLREKGMPVPAVVADLPEMKTLVMEDAGKDRKMSLEDYVKVVEALVRFNALGSAPDLPRLLPQFDLDTWAWERGLFAEYLLGGRFHRGLPEAAERELEGVAARLEAEPKALVHRDFQSTNVVWKGDSFSFIDFQGMRLGPAAYDLASLVYDPYVRLSEGERRALAALYAKQSGRGEIVEVLPFAAVQRLVQCLGAYGRLMSVGQPQFVQYVMPALENLLAAADQAGLDAVGALAEDLIAEEGRLHKDHHHHHAHGSCSCGHDHG